MAKGIIIKTKTMTVEDKLISIYFKQGYMGVLGEVTDEELEYIHSNSFKCVITEETIMNGYKGNKELAMNWLEKDFEYELLDMCVSQSSSTLRLVIFPEINFNTVLFEISKM